MSFKYFRHDDFSDLAENWAQVNKESARASSEERREELLKRQEEILDAFWDRLPPKGEYGCCPADWPPDHRTLLLGQGSEPEPGFRRRWGGTESQYLVQYRCPEGAVANLPEFYFPGKDNDAPRVAYLQHCFLRAVERHVPDVLKDLRQRLILSEGPSDDSDVSEARSNQMEELKACWDEPEVVLLKRGKQDLQDWAKKYHLIEADRKDLWIRQAARRTFRDWAGAQSAPYRASGARLQWALFYRQDAPPPESPEEAPFPHTHRIGMGFWTPIWESRAMAERRLLVEFRTALVHRLDEIEKLHLGWGFRKSFDTKNWRQIADTNNAAKWLALYQCGGARWVDIAEHDPAERTWIPKKPLSEDEWTDRSDPHEGKGFARATDRQRTVRRAATKLAEDIDLALRKRSP